jgi:release factor glutamine methyltransferase
MFTMTALAKMKEITMLFEQSRIEDPAREAEMLVSGLLDLDRAGLYTGDALMPEDRVNYIDELAVRRTRGEPIQYLIGYVLFYGLKIRVGSGVLIPRPETELLVEEAVKVVERQASSVKRERINEKLTILDLCTGSGCIALSIARHFAGAIVYGVDASEAAMVYATQNARANDVHNVRFKLGDLFEPVNTLHFDCIVSNPPYVRHDEIKTLQREIREHEPISALDGGRDGLDFYRRIFRNAPAYLKGNGIIVLEIGFGQSAAIRALALSAGFTQLHFIKDFAGIDRVFTAKLPGER